MSVDFQRITRCYIPEDSTLQNVINSWNTDAQEPERIYISLTMQQIIIMITEADSQSIQAI
jgi:hypothetical protein